MDTSTVTLSYTNQSIGGSLSLRDVVGQNVDGTWNNCTLCCGGQPPFEVNSKSVGWVRVDAQSTKVDGNAVVLSPLPVPSSDVVGVRYAWTDFVECVLQNDQGLVATPFVRNASAASIVTPQGETAAATAAAPDAPQTQSLSPVMGFNSWNFYHCNSKFDCVLRVLQVVLGGVSCACDLPS